MSPLLAALAAQRRFILFKLVPLADGRTDKIPVDPATGRNSNSQDEATWMLPAVALAWAATYGAGYGVGIAFREPCGIFCVDIDGCVENGQLTPLAQAIVAQFMGCYIEWSQSGKGLHIFGTYTGAPPIHASKNTALHIELYHERRFIALTGNLLAPHFATLRDATNEFWALAASYFQRIGSDASQDLTDAPVWPVVGVEAVKRSKPRFAQLLAGEQLNADASNQDLEFVCYALEAFGGNGEATRAWLETDHGYEFSEKKTGRMDYYLPRTILKAFDRLRDDPTINVRFGGDVPAGASPTPVPPAPPGPLPPAIPRALFECTDQSNAERIQRHYGAELISIADDFYAWDGRRWALDDGRALRLACHLSQIVSGERNYATDHLRALEARAAAGEALGDEIAAGEAKVDALGKWANKCEMAGTQNAALNMLRELLRVDPEAVDADPWALNVVNGTIDLRTGEVRAHRSADLITKLAPVPYDPAARAPRFERFLSEIVVGDAALVGFLQRWYGYAVTGDVSEQKILIKLGPGGNGKTTLGEAIDNVIGEYSAPATMGLLTGKDDTGGTAQLAEIASLKGKRLVIASESDDGARLKEAHLKKLTGGDMLTGKRLYAQLMSFRPTHKLELLTNHKPVIRGSDFSIWRRIMLLNFPVKFGSPGEVARGDATAVRDATLAAALKSEAPGILAWIVAGARLWLSAGLAPPDSMLAASAEYRQTQDHVAEFLADQCMVAPEARASLKSLYASYKAWCHEAGRDHPMMKQRFVDELERRVARFVRTDRDSVAGLSLRV